MTEVLAEQLETEESMFVQTAQGIDSDGQTLTLRGITPSTLYFSDRPKRVVGHMSTADFVDLWAIGDNSFETDPPNAVLAFLEPDADAPDDAVVVLKKPNLDGGGDLLTRSRCWREPFRRRGDRSRCSSTRLDGRSHPSRCAECGGESGDACDDGRSDRSAERSRQRDLVQRTEVGLTHPRIAVPVVPQDLQDGCGAARESRR